MNIVPKLIATLVASMIPAIEIKAAIPFGIALGLRAPVAFITALIGSSIILCFLAYFTRWFYDECKRRGWMKRFIGWMDRITSRHQQRFRRWGALAIFVYVAVPVPGTGTWTGAIIASVFNIKPKMIILSVFCGNIISGLIVTLVGSEVVGIIKHFI